MVELISETDTTWCFLGMITGREGIKRTTSKMLLICVQVISNGRVSEDTSPAATPNSRQTSLTCLERGDYDPKLTGRDVAVCMQASPQHTVDSNDTASETNMEVQCISFSNDKNNNNHLALYVFLPLTESSLQ